MLISIIIVIIIIIMFIITCVITLDCLLVSYIRGRPDTCYIHKSYIYIYIYIHIHILYIYIYIYTVLQSTIVSFRLPWQMVDSLCKLLCKGASFTSAQCLCSLLPRPPRRARHSSYVTSDIIIIIIIII